MREDGTETVAQRLGAYIGATGDGDLPAEVRHQAKRCLVDWLGLALAGSREPLGEMLLAVCDTMAGPPQATVVGRGKRRAADAALLNGAQAHALDFDDTIVAVHVHPTAPIMSAAVALAEWRARGGAALLTAYVVGLEVATRLAVALRDRLLAYGWHPTGVVGTVGAAAACAKLLALDAVQAASALGIAASQAAGLRENFGTMTKPLHAGQAAASGLLAALLAARGYTAAATAFEGAAGFGRAFGGAALDIDAALADLGANRWVLADAFKPYPCGVLSHAAIDAAIALHGAFRPAEIATVECRVSPTTATVVSKRAPRTGLEGKFSLTYCVAAGLCDGRVGVATFSDAAVARPDVRALERRVSVVGDDGLGDDQAVLRVEGPGGATRELRIAAAKGSIGQPLSDADLEAKYRDLAQGVLTPAQAQRLLERAWRVDALADVGELLALAC